MDSVPPRRQWWWSFWGTAVAIVLALAAIATAIGLIYWAVLQELVYVLWILLIALVAVGFLIGRFPVPVAFFGWFAYRTRATDPRQG